MGHGGVDDWDTSNPHPDAAWWVPPCTAVTTASGGVVWVDPVTIRVGRFNVQDPGRRRPVPVNVDVTGKIHCGCRATRPFGRGLGEDPGCRHTRYVRARHHDPHRVACDELVQLWHVMEAWRDDPDRRARWAIVAARRLQDAQAAAELADQDRDAMRRTITQTTGDVDAGRAALMERMARPGPPTGGAAFISADDRRTLESNTDRWGNPL